MQHVLSPLEETETGGGSHIGYLLLGPSQKKLASV